MKRTFISALIITGMAAVTGAASAATLVNDNSGFAGLGSGWYIGANAGYSENNWKAIDSLSYGIKDKNGLTYGANAGYMFNSNVGVELAYDVYPDAKLTNNADGSQIGKIKNQNYFSLSGVFSTPLNLEWALFAKLGVAYLNPKTNFDGGNAPTVRAKLYAPQVAIGSAYHLNPNMNLVVQYKHIFEQRNVVQTQAAGETARSGQNTPGYDAVTVGINYKF